MVGRIGNGCFYSLEDIVGRSQAVVNLKRLIKLYSRSDGPVLIEGESGTGKELIAQSIHNLSDRKKNPFIAINMAALPVELVESELFGYEKGAFTGSNPEGYSGKIVAAQGGTIFFDEIGEMPPSLQPKLLRLLQEGAIFPLGGKREIKVDVRIIAATNKDLEKEIDEGFFREDLFYRINLFRIKAPPLRQRKDDIPLLLNYFAERFQKRYQLDKKFSFSKKVIEILCLYSWPGNVRELQNFVERELWFALEEGIEEVNHIPDYILQRIEQKKDISYNQHRWEKVILEQALQEHNYKISLTAKALGMSRSTLYRKLKKYGIKV